MKKKAIIFDLDNTIYSVKSIGDELFAPLFDLIFKDTGHAEEEDKIREDIMRRPFQQVAKDYQFSKELTEQGIAHLKEARFEGDIQPFEDYVHVKKLPLDKFLVTTGFMKLQQSKVERMNLRSDFKDIQIVDPMVSDKTKKDVFAEIMDKHGYDKTEVLVVGDDLHSEIKAAQELGIDAILYDKSNGQNNRVQVMKISNFNQLQSILS
jgi:putative hydrolase of the HAD superfamily